MEPPNNNNISRSFSPRHSQYGGSQRGFSGGGDSVDPAAYDRDFEHKEKLLRKWDKYFPHESQQAFDVSNNLLLHICTSSNILSH